MQVKRLRIRGRIPGLIAESVKRRLTILGAYKGR